MKGIQQISIHKYPLMKSHLLFFSCKVVIGFLDRFFSTSFARTEYWTFNLLWFRQMRAKRVGKTFNIFIEMNGLESSIMILKYKYWWRKIQEPLISLIYFLSFRLVKKSDCMQFTSLQNYEHNFQPASNSFGKNIDWNLF